MVSPYTAQCPNCLAEIDLTQDDLEVAKGDIICGNCDNQFHAPDYLLKGFFSAQRGSKGKAPKAPKLGKQNKSQDTSATFNNEIMNTSDFDVAPGYSSYRRKRFFKSFFAATANLILILFLSFQLLWINFDEWAAKENIRPVYGFLCSIEQLKCRLPSFVEPIDIKAERFEVNLRSDGVYVLQATLTNYASIPKSFPWIEVIFSDINDYPVASGKFSPYQYLDKGVVTSLMPPGRIYDVLLEINSPSSPVAKYEMNVIAVD